MHKSQSLGVRGRHAPKQKRSNHQRGQEQEQLTLTGLRLRGRLGRQSRGPVAGDTKWRVIQAGEFTQAIRKSGKRGSETGVAHIGREVDM